MRGLLPRMAVFLVIASPFASQGQAPAPDTESLKYFAGAWHCEGHFISNGAAIASTISAEWNEAAHALTVHHDDSAPNAYHAIELWAAAKEPGEYRSSIVDAYSGMRWFASPGWSGQALSWTRSDKGQPVERFVYSRTGPSSMTVDWLVSRDHVNFAVGDTLNCQRV